MDERQKELRRRLIAVCITQYQQWIKSKGISLKMDPMETQQWHHQFDPHTMVQEVAESELKQPPTAIRSESLNNFIRNPGNRQQMVMKAMTAVKEEEAKRSKSK